MGGAAATGAAVIQNRSRRTNFLMADGTAKPLLSVEGLTKIVPSPEGELTVLANVDFIIHEAETAAILGPSGAGKSTLLGLLAGLDRPSRGRVVLNGEDLFALDEDQRARLRGSLIGFVFQSFQLLPSLTALENVMLPLELSGRPDAAEVAGGVLERVGLGPRIQHYPRQLSGGEQQRVAIARAFAPQPKLLLADEPTGNLDNRTGEHVIDLLFDLNREHGTTLVLVTHDEELAGRCQRRLNMEGGCLVDAP